MMAVSCEKTNMKKIARMTLLVLMDILLINLAVFITLYAGYEFRWNAFLTADFWRILPVYLPVNTALTLFVFAAMDLYQSLWQYAGVEELERIAVASAVCSLATVLAQGIVTGMFWLAARRDTILFPQIRLFAPSEKQAWGEILKIGLPVSVQSMFFSSLSMFLARIVAGWGDAAIAAQKVGTQIESISYTTAEGFATAVNAFVAQNFGAGKPERIRRGYWTAIGMITVWSCFTTVMLVVFPEPLFRIFIQEEDVLQTGVSYLRIMGYSQILMCLEITASGAFQGLGRPMPPTLAGIIGNAARIPMALLLSATALGLDGVWWSISISSIAKGVVVFAWFVVVLRRYLRSEEDRLPGA